MRRAALAALLASLFSAACAGPPGLGEASEAIVGGTPDSGDPAVVMLVSYAMDESTFDTCSASLIAPTVLLTAAHCVDPSTHPGYGYGVYTGPDASAYPTAMELVPQLAAVTAEHVNPTYDPTSPFHGDLGVVVLAEPIDVTPLRVNRVPVSASLPGAAARIVGYGQTTYGVFNEAKNDATTVVDSVGSDDTIVVGDDTHKSCVGDSGGPALVEVGGVETIMGVDSYTDVAGCLDPASYRRPDLYLSFIDTYAPPPAVDAGTDAGGGEGGGGGEPTPAKSSGCATAPGARGGPIGAAVVTLGLAWIAARRRRRHAATMRPAAKALTGGRRPS